MTRGTYKKHDYKTITLKLTNDEVEKLNAWRIKQEPIIERESLYQMIVRKFIEEL